jgi:hypothetical protein
MIASTTQKGELFLAEFPTTIFNVYDLSGRLVPPGSKLVLYCIEFPFFIIIADTYGSSWFHRYADKSLQDLCRSKLGTALIWDARWYLSDSDYDWDARWNLSNSDYDYDYKKIQQKDLILYTYLPYKGRAFFEIIDQSI